MNQQKEKLITILFSIALIVGFSISPHVINQKNSDVESNDETTSYPAIAESDTELQVKEELVETKQETTLEPTPDEETPVSNNTDVVGSQSTDYVQTPYYQPLFVQIIPPISGMIDFRNHSGGDTEAFAMRTLSVFTNGGDIQWYISSSNVPRTFIGSGNNLVGTYVYLPKSLSCLDSTFTITVVVTDSKGVSKEDREAHSGIYPNCDRQPLPPGSVWDPDEPAPYPPVVIPMPDPRTYQYP